jgi:spectinomycin phosphotransferase
MIRLVRSPAAFVDDVTLRDALAAGWGLEATSVRYLPVGGGAYHWAADCAGGVSKFVTCDDLDTKAWLGLGRDRGSVFEGLSAAYRVAMDLRSAGASFVVAPLPTLDGSPTWRLDDGHGLSVFDFVDGQPGRWSERPTRRQCDDLVETLVALHAMTPPTAHLRRRVLEVPGRADLEDALRHLDQPWAGGPLSEPTRRELEQGASAVTALVRELDDLVERLGDGSGLVVTHGEPHPGNLIFTGSGPALVDWDTVALAPPERDLWMIAEVGDEPITTYERLTGTSIDRGALRAWRLAWALTDLAAFTTLLRGPHDRHTDTERSLAGLRLILAGEEPRPYGEPRGH